MRPDWGTDGGHMNRAPVSAAIVTFLLHVWLIVNCHFITVVSPERQSVRLSEIKNGRLGLHGADYMITLGFKGLNEHFVDEILTRRCRYSLTGGRYNSLGAQGG